MSRADNAITFRPCAAADVEDSIPLILSSGPDQYRYVLAVSHKDQDTEFLRYAFVRTKGQFSHSRHTAVLSGGQFVGIVGLATKKTQFEFLVHALLAIFGFYGFFNGIRVVYRGLRLERVLKPPRARVGLIYNLAILSTMRGRGLGRQVISHMIDKIRQLQLPLIALDVVDNNPRAKALYQRLGFRDVEQRKSTLKNKFGEVRTHDYMELPITKPSSC